MSLITLVRTVMLMLFSEEPKACDQLHKYLFTIEFNLLSP
jgi:hypothetical protein